VLPAFLAEMMREASGESRDCFTCAERLALKDHDGNAFEDEKRTPCGL